MSQAAAAETTAAAAVISSWSCRTGSLVFEATGSSPCVSDAGHDHGKRDTPRIMMRDHQRQPAAAASIISPLPAASADATAHLGKPSPDRLTIRQSVLDGGHFTTRSHSTACDARRRVAAVTTEQQVPASETGAAEDTAAPDRELHEWPIIPAPSIVPWSTTSRVTSPTTDGARAKVVISSPTPS